MVYSRRCAGPCCTQLNDTNPTLQTNLQSNIRVDSVTVRSIAYILHARIAYNLPLNDINLIKT